MTPELSCHVSIRQLRLDMTLEIGKISYGLLSYPKIEKVLDL